MQISAIDMQMSRLAHRPMNVEQRETLDRRNRNAFNCRFRLRFLLSSSSSSSLFRFVLESTLHSLSLSLSLGRNWALRDLCSHANALDSYANDGRPSEQLTNEKKTHKGRRRCPSRCTQWYLGFWRFFFHQSAAEERADRKTRLDLPRVDTHAILKWTGRHVIGRVDQWETSADVSLSLSLSLSVCGRFICIPSRRQFSGAIKINDANEMKTSKIKTTTSSSCTELYRVYRVFKDLLETSICINEKRESKNKTRMNKFVSITMLISMSNFRHEKLETTSTFLSDHSLNISNKEMEKQLRNFLTKEFFFL